MQVVVADKELDTPASETASTNSFPSSADTPSFVPNAPPFDLPPEYVSIEAVMASLSRPGKGKVEIEDIELPDLDFSLPVSKLLRIGTSRAHVRAENSDGAVALVKGQLSLEEYIRWLAVLWRVYSALELGLSEHASDPILAPTYNPSVLARAHSIAKDITHLLTLLPDSPRPTSALKPPEDAPLPPFPVPPFLMPVFVVTPPPLAAYINHLRDLAASADTAPRLMAHAYVRYLGDLSGGQYIAARLRKAFDLEREEGLLFYKFQLDNVEESSQIGAIKEWYRAGMDEGVGEDLELKELLVKEANLAFALNIHLFSLIRQPLTNAVGSPLSASDPTQISVPRYDASGRPLRYFEIRELQKQEKARVKLLMNGPEKPNTWRDRIERFLLFSSAAGISWVVGQYGVPYLKDVVLPQAQLFLQSRGWLSAHSESEL